MLPLIQKRCNTLSAGASPALSAASFASTDSEVSAKKPLLTICDTEWDKLCKRASELGKLQVLVHTRLETV